MKMENLISDALCQPSDFVPYYVSSRLAEMYPDSAIVESEYWSFDIDEFARAGHCSIMSVTSVHQQVQTIWQGREEDLGREIENGWCSVFWEDQLIDVVSITWTDAGCETTRHWIIAQAPETAQGFLRAVCEYCDDVHGEILVYDDGYWTKDEKLFDAIRLSTFENLVLPQSLKTELREDFRRFLASRDLYERLGIPWKRGVLLIGPPGNGKTHTIKALVNELRLPCLYIKSFQQSRSTEQSSMRRVFERARLSAPCLLIMEDLDAMVNDENRSFLLNELDGFADNTGVIVVASTNHPEKLDPAILDRPSRFDRKYHFPLPATGERFDYLAGWNRSCQEELHLEDDELRAVAEKTDAFSYAYLKELCLSSMMQWIAHPEPGRMFQTMLERADVLREQMKK